MRDKLIELIGDAPYGLRTLGQAADELISVESIADHLIAHGVTVQKHGRWLDGICTNCGVEALEYIDEEGDWVVYTTDNCPNCGAKMDGEA